MTAAFFGAAADAVAAVGARFGARAAAETFGPAEGEAWGAEAGGGSAWKNVAEYGLKRLARKIDLGDGNSLTLDPEAIRAVMWSEGMIAQLTAAGQRVADVANETAQIEGAEYKVIVQDQDRSFPTPRVLVVAANYEAKLDEAKHATLTSAMNSAGGGVQAETIPVTW